MTSESLQEIYDKLSVLIEEGGQEETKKFLLEHIKEFSEEEQGDIITAFVEDALDKQRGETEAVAEFQKSVIDIFRKLEAQKADLEKQDALLKIKQSI